MCYNQISITGGDYNERNGGTMSEPQNNTPANAEAELTDLEKSIISDFDQLDDVSKSAVLDYIISILH